MLPDTSQVKTPGGRAVWGGGIQIKVHSFSIQGRDDPILAGRDLHVHIVYLFGSFLKDPF